MKMKCQIILLYPNRYRNIKIKLNIIFGNVSVQPVYNDLS